MGGRDGKKATDEECTYIQRQLPRHFDRYSPADQARSTNQTVAVLRAVERGEELAAGPFSVVELPLVEALVELNLPEGD